MNLKWICPSWTSLLSPDAAQLDSDPVGPVHKPDLIAPPVSGKAGAFSARRCYADVRTKFLLALGLSVAWFLASAGMAGPWIHDLSELAGTPLALIIVAGIALVPGFMNAFLAVSLMLDRRPSRRRLKEYPGVTILIAAYNEAAAIADTIESVAKQNYRGNFEVLVIDDGSRDDTADIVAALQYPWLQLIRQPCNRGKARALNRGLLVAKYDLIITLDADCYL